MRESNAYAPPERAMRERRHDFFLIFVQLFGEKFLYDEKGGI